jgi:hypothetical protein
MICRHSFLTNVKRMACHLTAACLLVCIVALAQAQQKTGKKVADSQPRGNDPAKFALLIGINDYESPVIRDPKSAVNDVEDMRKVLEDLYAFEPRNILLLKDRGATRQAILNGFKKHLIENARNNPNAVIYLYFSGIGSKVRDSNGDEVDGIDETIVPSDGRMRDIFDITDDELDVLLAELNKYTSNVTVVYDTNFGFDESRESEVVKGITRETSVPRQTAPMNTLPVASNLLPRFNKSGLAVINATLPGQNSFEADFKQDGVNRKNSVLTYYLIHELRKSPVTTYRDLVQRVADQIRLYYRQTPQVDGDLDRLFLGGVSRAFDVKVDKAVGNQITLNAGTQQGLSKGVRIAVFSPQARSFTDYYDKLTEAIIVEATEYSAVAEITRKVSIPPGAKAVFAAHISSEHLRVAFDGTSLRSLSSGEGIIDSLRERFNNISSLTAIGETQLGIDGGTQEDSWDVIITAGKFGNVFGSVKAQLTAIARSSNVKPLSDNQDVFYIAGQDKHPLFGFFVETTDKEAANKIAEAARQASMQRLLKRLYHEASALNKALEVSVVRVEGEVKLSGLLKITAEKPVIPEDGAGTTFRLNYGDLFRLKVRNKSLSNVYLTALNLGTDGRVDVFHQAEKEAGLLRTGETYTSLVYRATGFAGEDIFKFIASTSPFEFPSMTSVRGSETVRAIEEDWGTTQISLMVAEPSSVENVSQKRVVEFINRNLYLIAIGINEHSDPKRRLKFSITDAQAMATSLTERGGEVYNISAHLLLNEQATRSGIENAFKKIISESRPEDVFIFYNPTYDFTGLEQEDAPGEWFIVPQDVVPSDDPKSDWKKNAISGELLRTWVSSIKAQNQLLIFDSSPAALERFVLGLSNDRKAASVMLKKNFVVFGGNGSEVIELNHAEFTYNLLQGLDGKAYYGLTRNQITVRDMQHFLRGAKSRQRGSRLFQSFSIGDDFSLGGVPKELAEKTRDVGVDKDFADPEQGRVKRTGKDYALFIATDAYDDKTFKEISNPVRDAEALAGVLQDKYGFEVEVLKNKSKKEIEQIIENKYLDIAADEHDQLFIFFSGHGDYKERLRDGGIAVKDSMTNDINTYLRFRWIQERLESFSCPHVLIVVDACYSGSFFGKIVAGTKDNSAANRARMSDADYYKDRIKNPARKAITSAALKPSWDSIPGIPGSHSPLATELLLLLGKTEDMNYVAFDDMKVRINKVKPGPVSGDFGGDPGSDFFFVPKRKP